MSAWRKGCGGVGERPRLYEQVDLDGDLDGDGDGGSNDGGGDDDDR